MHDTKGPNSVPQFLIRMKILITLGLWLKPLSHRPVLLLLLQWRGVFKCDSLRSFWGSVIMTKCWLSFPSVIHLVPREESKFKFLCLCRYYSSTQDSDRASVSTEVAILISILLFFLMYNIYWFQRLIFQISSSGWWHCVWKCVRNGPAGGSRVARHRCWPPCGSANYAPLLDAMLTFNAAALTRRQMQLSDAAALPLGLRSCLSMAFNSKKQLQRRSRSPPSATGEITDAIVPTVIYLLFTTISCSIYPENLTPQNLIILSWIWRYTEWGFMHQLIKTDSKTRSDPHAE